MRFLVTCIDMYFPGEVISCSMQVRYLYSGYSTIQRDYHETVYN